ncbi:MAG: indole-3-glycerol-phosphate synthase [Methanomassiliicoccus sp.]|nr:indole-3-glycerol-phosphate synthase [Methanomassiliicoccus sp.]
MTDMLETLVRDAQRTVGSGYYDVVDSFRPGVGLSAALSAHPRFPVIAEVKLASPSRGSFSIHSPEKLIGSYISGGAAALSVLTEPGAFQGSLDSLRKAVRSGRPVLMKDFLVSRRQLEAAAAIGAGTVLMIQEVFDFLPLSSRDGLIDLAHQSGLEVLLEAGSEKTLMEAMKSDADLLGINQRDLRTFIIDKDKGVRLLPLALQASRPVVVMSGIEERRAVEVLKEMGASGVLVGGSLSSSKDPEAALGGLVVPR